MASGSKPPAQRPWAHDLHERLWTHSRGRSRFALPRPPTGTTRARALSAKQLRALRTKWIGLHVALHDFTATQRCSRQIAMRRACTLDDLTTVLCAAVGFSDDEHLYTYDLPGGRYSHHVLALNDGCATTDIALSELGLRNGERFWQMYDMGDAWQFNCRVQTIPPDIVAVLRPLSTDPFAAPALQYASHGRAPRQYSHHRE
jgi:hypothetical protein